MKIVCWKKYEQITVEMKKKKERKMETKLWWKRRYSQNPFLRAIYWRRCAMSSRKTLTSGNPPQYGVKSSKLSEVENMPKT